MLIFIQDSFPGTFALPCINNHFTLSLAFNGERYYSHTDVKKQNCKQASFACPIVESRGVTLFEYRESKWRPFTSTPFIPNIEDDSRISTILPLIQLPLSHMADDCRSITVTDVESLKHRFLGDYFGVQRLFLLSGGERHKEHKTILIA